MGSGTGPSCSECSNFAGTEDTDVPHLAAPRQILFDGKVRSIVDSDQLSEVMPYLVAVMF